MRDTPDPAQKFGAPTPGPLVWHTYRAKIEIFPVVTARACRRTGTPRTVRPTTGMMTPQYIYNAAAVGSQDGQVQPCSGQSPVSQPAWINLDEVTQIGLDSDVRGRRPRGLDVDEQ